jgi:hypothetical protein
VGWERMDWQEEQVPTVCAWEKMVVIEKQPLKMRNRRSDQIRDRSERGRNTHQDT